MDTRRWPTGTRVRLRRAVERFPFAIVPAGALGTVHASDVREQAALFAVQLDETIPEFAEWDNCIMWYGTDETGAALADDIEAVTTEDAARTFPTLYSMEAIGAGGALEAVEAFHFCSPACRTTWAQAAAPLDGARWQEGDETLSLEGMECEQCGAPLDRLHGFRARPSDPYIGRLYDLLSRALSVIELSEGADEHAELIAELRAVVR